jgi:hypothetical protein
MNNDVTSVSTNVAGADQAGKTLGIAYPDNFQAHSMSSNNGSPQGDSISLSAQGRTASSGANAYPAISDHDTRTAPVGARTLQVDPSGSYKVS